MPGLSLNTGAAIPVVGFGTWQILLNGTAKRAVMEALAAGYRLIDTARIYGNEKGVGAGIRESGIPREDIFVTTKLWNSSHGRDKALAAFDGSLKRLGLDYVDLYLIHWPVPGKRQETWKALEELQKSGRVRAIGVSNYMVHHLTELLEHAEIPPAVDQVEFHPFLYEDRRQLLDFCSNHGIVVEAYSPLAHAARLHDPVITKVAVSHKKSNAQVMLRWAVQHGTVPLPKSSNPARIVENLRIFDFELTESDMRALNDLSDGTHTCWNPDDRA